jgi:hypothetical protein
MITAPVLLSQDQQELVHYIIFGNEFPWYRQPDQTQIIFETKTHLNISNPPFFSHCIIKRSDDSLTSGEPKSSYYQYFYEIFDSWMKNNKIEYSKIYRASINCVHHSAGDCSVPHLDHNFDHKNWIWYLNTVKMAPTLLFDNDHNIMAAIPCEANTAVTFGNTLHAQCFPPMDEHRLVVVFTYS